MRVPLGGFDLGMTQQFLHFIQRATAIDQERSERMAQVVNAQLFQPRPLSDHIPGIKNVLVGFLGIWIGKDPVTVFNFWDLV